jgi:hypothetical protein
MTEIDNGRLCSRCRSYIPSGGSFLCTACLQAVQAEARNRVRDQFLQAIAEKTARAAMEARP